MTNFNKKGMQYESISFANPRHGYGIISDDLLSLISDIRTEIKSRIKTHNTDKICISIDRIMNRFNAILYHASLVKNYQIEIENIRPNKNEKVMKNHTELGFSFESLIFHAAATLDSFSIFLSDNLTSRETIKNKQKIYFSNIDKSLHDSSDCRSDRILNIINECKNDLANIIHSVGRKTLRNNIAHEKPVFELSDSQFIIYGIDDGRILRFDQDVYKMPLLKSGINLVTSISYIIIKSAIILLTIDRQGLKKGPFKKLLDIDKIFFTPKWVSPFVNWREYEPLSIERKEPLVFTISKANTNGFQINNINLSERILEKALLK